MQPVDVPLAITTAYDHELAVSKLVPCARPGPEQPVAVLVRPQRGDEQDERPGDPVAARPGCEPRGVARREQLVVHRLVDQLELAVIDVEMLPDLRAQAVGVDDDRIREPSGARVVHPAVCPGRWADRFRER